METVRGVTGERGGGKWRAKPRKPHSIKMDNGRQTWRLEEIQFFVCDTESNTPRLTTRTQLNERERDKKKARKESERGRASKSNLSLAAQLIFFRGESALLCLRKRLAQNTLAELKHFILSLVRLLEHRNALFQVGN